MLKLPLIRANSRLRLLHRSKLSLNQRRDQRWQCVKRIVSYLPRRSNDKRIRTSVSRPKCHHGSMLAYKSCLLEVWHQIHSCARALFQDRLALKRPKARRAAGEVWHHSITICSCRNHKSWSTSLTCSLVEEEVWTCSLLVKPGKRRRRLPYLRSCSEAVKKI